MWFIFEPTSGDSNLQPDQLFKKYRDQNHRPLVANLEYQENRDGRTFLARPLLIVICESTFADSNRPRDRSFQMSAGLVHRLSEKEKACQENTGDRVSVARPAAR